MGMNLAFHYFIISKAEGRCVQYINSNRKGWFINNDTDFSIQMDGEYNVLNNYLLRPDMTPAQSGDDHADWYRKVWNELDEDGIPVEESGFTWEAFTPELVAG